MLIEERHRAILEMLGQAGRITTGEIQKRFCISYDSVKRDLRILEKKGLLQRIHGGAIMVRVGDQNAQKKEGKNAPRSQEDRHLSIAMRAIAEIASQEVVYITAENIGYLMARNMPDDRIFTVVTNSAEVAGELRTKGNITVILAGGEVGSNGSFCDGFSPEILECLHFDKCFITSACISPEFGLSVEGKNQLELRNTIIRNSRKVYGLYPAEKVGMGAEVRICGVEKLDVLITDEEAPGEELKEFEDVGVEVIVSRGEIEKQEGAIWR